MKGKIYKVPVGQLKSLGIPNKEASKVLSSINQETDHETDAKNNAEGTWSLVGNLRKHKVNTIHGKKEVESTCSALRVVTRKTGQYWNLYVGNLAVDIINPEIDSFLKDSGVQMMDCWILNQRYIIILVQGFKFLCVIVIECCLIILGQKAPRSGLGL